MISLSEYRLEVTVWVINTVVVAGLLFVAIFNLYYVQSDQNRLGILAAYTMTFSLCMALLTNARRGEIFGAAAAYAAVLVLFVSRGLGGNSNNQELLRLLREACRQSAAT